MKEPKVKQYNRQSTKSAAYGNMVIYIVPIIMSFVLYNYLAGIQFNPYATLSIFVAAIMMSIEFSKTLIRRVEDQVKYEDVILALYFETPGHPYLERLITRSIRPVALLDDNYEVISQNPTREFLTSLETTQLKSGYIEYEIDMHEQSQLFDRLLFAVRISWHRMVVKMPDEYPFKYILVSGKSIPIVLVKLREWLHQGVRTVLTEVGFSAFDAELIQMKHKVMSIQQTTVKVKRPVKIVNAQGVETTSIEEVEVPIAEALLDNYGMVKFAESQQIIRSRDIEIATKKEGERDFDKRVLEFTGRRERLKGAALKKGLPVSTAEKPSIFKNRAVRWGLITFVLIMAALVTFGVIKIT